MNILPQNKIPLAKRFPETFKRIHEIKNDSQPFEIKENTLYHNKKPVYGKNKDAIINRWIKGIKVDSSTFYTITGFGTGEHIAKLLEQCPDIKAILIGEENTLLLKKVFSTIDCSQILSDPRVLLGTGTLDSDFFGCMSSVHYAGIKKAILITFSPLFSTNESYYKQFLDECTKSFQYWKKVYTANLTDATFVQEMSLRNLPLLLSAPDIEILENAFANIPTILVGAGPSLDLSIDFLKSVNDKAIIACVNTSYRKLINSGIKPHITVAVDPRPSTFKGYQNIETKDVFLICPYCVNVEVPKVFNKRTFTWSTQNPIPLALRKRLGKNPGSFIAERGTVSACVIDLAKNWGSKQIIMVGQDFAYTKEGKTHTEDSFYKEEGRLTVNPHKNSQLLPGNTIEKVHVEERLFVYLSAFEQLIDENPDIEFINTSILGAKVRGANYKTFKDTLPLFQNKQTLQIGDILKNKLEDYNKKLNTSQSPQDLLTPTKEFTHKLFEKSLLAAMHCDFLPESFKSLNYQNHPQLQQCDQYADEVNHLIDAHPDDYEILFHGGTKKHLVNYQMKTERLNDAIPWERANKNKEFFWAIAEGCNELESELNKNIYASN